MDFALKEILSFDYTIKNIYLFAKKNMFRKQNREKNMFVLAYLDSISPLGPSLKSHLANKIRSCFFKKNEFVNKKGEVCNKLYIIKTGMIRGYFKIGNHEITTWIDCENEISTSITGFFRHEKSEEFIQCLEDTYCDYLDYEDYKYCLLNFPEMRKINTILLEHYYIMAEKRALLARLPNAKNRLNHFIKTYKPDMVNRIPKKHLASFLSIRPETLSRILKEKN